MDPETHSSVIKLIQQYHPAKGAPAKGDNTHVVAFLQNDCDASLPYQVPRLTSPPLFAREYNPGGSLIVNGSESNAPGLRGANELRQLIQLSENIVDEEEHDLHQQHMDMIDGWGEYRVPCRKWMRDSG